MPFYNGMTAVYHVIPTEVGIHKADSMDAVLPRHDDCL
jgi:hypothetical protein